MVEMEKSLMLFTHYLLGYVGTVICSIGLILALCSVYIFTRRQMRSNVSTYLTGLSISDSCLLSLGLIFAINSSIPPNQQSESFYSSRLHKYLFPYVYACIIWFQFTSVWITIGFAVDRWFAIKWPMIHYTHSSKRACYIVLIIYGLGFIYSLPRFFEYKAEVQTEDLIVLDNHTESFTYVVIKNKLYNSTFYQYTVHLTLKSLFQSILPLLMLSYFNVELIRSVNASSRFLKRCTSTYGPNTRPGGETSIIRYREVVITRSVICLIGLFIICQVPASILNYIYMFYRNHKWLYICYDISNFLVLLNSAVNFFVFTCFNRKFRRELARVCFHTKTRSYFFRPSTQQFLKQTSSSPRSIQLNHLNIVHPDYWEYQKRVQNGSIHSLRNKPSQSSYHLDPMCTRATSFNTTRSINKNPLKFNRYSVCEVNVKKSGSIGSKQRKATNFTYSKSKRKDFYTRRHSERYSFISKKSSLASHTSAISYDNREQSLHYITYNRQKLDGQLSSTTTTISNLTRSESSLFIDPNKLVKTSSNNLERPYRK